MSELLVEDPEKVIQQGKDRQYQFAFFAPIPY